MIGKAKEKITSSKLFYFTKDLVLHPFFSGSAIMIIGSNSANFFAYIYHLIMGRILGPSFYGELASILSVFGLFTTAFGFLGLVIVKFVSAAEESKLQSIFSWFAKKGLIFGVVTSFGLILATPFLSNFLKIEAKTILLLSPIFFLAVLGFVYRSFLQGLLRFKEVVISTNADIVGRIVFGLVFIFLGFKVFGAILGLVISTAIGFLLLRYFLRDYRITDAAKKFKKGRKVFNYAVPIFFASLATQSFFSTDVILVKHFFESFDAGIYASLSTLGKVIFYGAAPVSSVMFPMISRKHSKGESHRRVFILSLILSATISFGVVLIYWMFPELSISLLYGNEYLSGAPYLLWFGIFMALYTLSSLFTNYFLSKEKTKVVILPVVAAIMQFVGILLFHDSILTVVKVSIGSVSFLLVTLLLYFGYEAKYSRKS